MMTLCMVYEAIENLKASRNIHCFRYVINRFFDALIVDCGKCQGYPSDFGCLFLGEAVININPARCEYLIYLDDLVHRQIDQSIILKDAIVYDFPDNGHSGQFCYEQFESIRYLEDEYTK